MLRNTQGAKSWRSEAAKRKVRFKDGAHCKMLQFKDRVNPQATEANWNTVFGPVLAPAQTLSAEGNLKSC